MFAKRLKDHKTLLWLALLSGVVGDILFFKKAIGINFPIFIALLTGVMIFVTIRENGRVSYANLTLVIPLLFFSSMTAVRDSDLLSGLNFIGSLTMLGLLCANIAGEMLYEKNLWEMASGFLMAAVYTLLQPFGLLIRLFESKEEGEDGEEEKSGIGRRILVGALITIPVLILFTALLAGADMIFGQGVERLFENLSLENILPQLFLIGLFTFIAAGGYITAAVMNRERDPAAPIEAALGAEDGEEKKDGKFLGMIEAGILIFAVDALFLIFVLIQFAVLFGGEAYVKAQGVTYSEYARSGFFELLAVSVIVLGLLLLMEWITRRETKTHDLLFKVGSGLMIAFTLVMLFSAHTRMGLYESAYGYTIMRLYPHVFMGWLALLLVYVFILIVAGRPRYFASGLLVFCIGFLATMNILNPDRFIATRNINRYEAGQQLDTDYFVYDLTVDAAPVIVDFYDRVEDEDLRSELRDWLEYRNTQLEYRGDRDGIGTWHFAFNRAERLFAEIPGLADGD